MIFFLDREGKYLTIYCERLKNSEAKLKFFKTFWWWQLSSHGQKQRLVRSFFCY
jgi:hypothetical protein